MGRVYLGRSAAGRLVAVKTIRAEFAEEPDFRTRFAHEVAAARRVSGAFTAPVVAADSEADVPWLATAYVPAPPLSTLVTHCGPLPVPAVRWLAAGCAEALESIHGAGLVHRDLKPSNVLVSPDGPRVIDFGVARAAERIQLTLTRGAVGTPAYMAPEQARDTRRATTASDVYSLGATILFAATGHGPYRGDSVMDVLVHLATEPPDISGLPAELIEVVAACLERDPRRRPSSAAVLAHLAPGSAEPADSVFAMAPPLPPAALALLDKYRRDPRPADQPGQRADPDDTFGSYPSDRPGPRSGARHSSRQRGPARGPGSGEPARRRPAGRRGPVLTGLAAAVSAVVLLGGGVAVGRLFIPAKAGNGPTASSHKSQASTPNATQTHHPRTQPPVSGPLPDPLGKPIAKLIQTYGDPDTIFVIQGRDWPPGLPITVTLVGVGPSREHVTVDMAGIFNYAINQNHEFFRFGIPPGRYTVIVTAPNGLRATLRFNVHPPGPPPGPGVPPTA
jgi:serine/threonine protein kinase